MTWVGHYEFIIHVYKKYIVKNKRICINDRPKNGVMYLYYAFQYNVINGSTMYTKYKS